MTATAGVAANVAVSATAAIATSVAASIASAASTPVTTAIASPIAAFGLGLGFFELERGQVERQRLQADGEAKSER